MSRLPTWHDAAALAARAHRHQLRRDGETPYVAHPARVAIIVATIFGCTEERVLAAALVHDVIEDSGVDYDEVHELLGRDVADLCAAMTKDMRLIEDVREQAYDEQLASASWEARLLKLADVYDNLSDARIDRDRRKLLEKADRALALARGDAELADACRHLETLVDDVRGSLA